MHIKDFQTILDVYDNKSFSEAAFVSDFSASAISKQVARVEKELNVRIFERKNKGSSMELTKVGEQLIPEIRKLVDNYGNIERIAHQNNGVDNKVLNVGYVPLIGTIGETEVFTHFSNMYPDIQLNLYGSERIELIRKTLTGKLDATFVMMFGVSQKNYDTFELLSNADVKTIRTMTHHGLYVGLSKKHPLAKKKVLRMEELKNETFIFSKFQDPDRYDTRIEFIQGMLSGENRHLKTRFMDFTNKDMVLSVVQSGKAILPQVAVPLTHGYDIEYVPVMEWPDYTTGLFVYRRSSLTPSLRKLIKCVNEYAEAHIDTDAKK